KDADGRILYVGKAANLRTRVASYLRGGDGRPLVRLLMRRAADLDIVATRTPEEALLLENTFIKKERPPYNLRLKDDKSYLLVRVDRTHPFPRLRLVRRARKDGALYLGPFASAQALRRTLRFLRTLYPLRTCSDRELEERTRPCLYHQIGRCAAPCVDAITPEAYGRLVEQALALLRGRDDGVLARLREEMEEASDALAFEKAALVRDRIAALEAALERQGTVRPDGEDRDVVAVVTAGGTAMISVLYVRDGHVVAHRTWPQRTALGTQDVTTAFLGQFYLRGKIVPPEVLVAEEPADPEGLEEHLTRLRGGPVRVRRPVRGARRELMDMAVRNAELALDEHSARTRAAQDALRTLADLLGLGGLPGRIEGYDLSHLAGSEPVAGMSVLLGGVADRSSYRHFAVREAAGGDDYAGMREVIRRRFRAGHALGDLPDLVLVDGGRGQLEAARRAVRELGLPELPMVGLAKARRDGPRRDRLVLPDRPEAIVLAETDPAYRLLAKARDEAHRFAGRYQRKRRSLVLGQGALDGVPGIGPARKRMLIRHFGSVEALKAAPFEDLAGMPGIGERRARLLRERLGVGTDV
ncbi:MAG: excinuclease ABC subunit UvrC, partial [Planctomycetota bacterium]